MIDWYSALRDPSARKRIQAVKELVKSDYPHAVDLLKHAYRQEADPDVKQVIKRAGAYLRSAEPSSTISTTTQPSVLTSTSTDHAQHLTETPTEIDTSFRSYRSDLALYVIVVGFAVYLMIRIALVAVPPENASVDLNPQAAAMIISVIVSAFSLGSVLLESLIIHLLSTRVFDGKAMFTQLMKNTLNVRTYSFLIVIGVFGGMYLFGGVLIYQTIIVPVVAVLATGISIFIWLNRRISKTYQFNILKAIVAYLIGSNVASFLFGLVIQGLVTVVTPLFPQA